MFCQLFVQERECGRKTKLMRILSFQASPLSVHARSATNCEVAGNAIGGNWARAVIVCGPLLNCFSHQHYATQDAPPDLVTASGQRPCSRRSAGSAGRNATRGNNNDNKDLESPNKRPGQLAAGVNHCSFIVIRCMLDDVAVDR